jgi:hypothetical protein
MQLLVHRAQQLQPLKQQQLAEVLLGTQQAAVQQLRDRITAEQQGLLQQAAGVADAAEAVHLGQQQLLLQQLELERGRMSIHQQQHQLQDAAVGGEVLADQGLGAWEEEVLAREEAIRNVVPDGVEAVRKLRARLQEIERGLTQPGMEVAEVLAAVMLQEGGWRREDFVSFLQGHLYQCPNGHMYVIGNCGGAMQQARCAECGAVIGGRSHQLLEGNRRVDGQLVQEVGEAARQLREQR